MTDRSPRPTDPRRWRSLALAGATAGLAAASPVMGGALPSQSGAVAAGDAQIWLAAGEGMEGDDASATTPIASTEGGEGGEAGAVADAAPEVAYLAQLSIVEGHLFGAAELYRRGQTDDAIGLSYHPEAEMMDEVRTRLAAHGAGDISPSMAAFSATMEAGATPEAVNAALADVSAAIAAAMAQEKDAYRTRMDALVALLKGAADEYAGSIEDGQVADVMAWHEAHGFITVARHLAEGLAAEQDPAVAKAGTRSLAALAGADEAFGDVTAAELHVGDPAILMAVAAKVELIASSVRTGS
jgi:hypothetical protein